MLGRRSPLGVGIDWSIFTVFKGAAFERGVHCLEQTRPLHHDRAGSNRSNDTEHLLLLDIFRDVLLLPHPCTDVCSVPRTIAIDKRNLMRVRSLFSLTRMSRGRFSASLRSLVSSLPRSSTPGNEQASWGRRRMVPPRKLNC